MVTNGGDEPVWVSEGERDSGERVRTGESERSLGGEGESVALGAGSISGGSRRWLGRVPARGGHTPSCPLARG